MKKSTIIIALLCVIIMIAGCRDGQPANTVNTPAEAQGREIGVLYGTSSVRFAQELGNAGIYYNTREMTDALKNGALDCILMEKGPADTLASKTSRVKLLSEPFVEYDLAFAIAKENADLTTAVNRALAELYENGTLSGLRDRYVLGKSYAYIPREMEGDSRGVLTLAVPGDFPPYSYKNEDEVITGLDIDVARAVCDILGVEMQVVAEDWKNLITMVQFGKADFALGCIYANEEDGELVDFSDPYTNFTQLLLVRK